MDCLSGSNVLSEAYRQEFYSLWGISEQQAQVRTHTPHTLLYFVTLTSM